MKARNTRSYTCKAAASSSGPEGRWGLCTKGQPRWGWGSTPFRRPLDSDVSRRRLSHKAGITSLVQRHLLAGAVVAGPRHHPRHRRTHAAASKPRSGKPTTAGSRAACRLRAPSTQMTPRQRLGAGAGREGSRGPRRGAGNAGWAVCPSGSRGAAWLPGRGGRPRRAHPTRHPPLFTLRLGSCDPLIQTLSPTGTISDPRSQLSRLWQSSHP